MVRVHRSRDGFGPLPGIPGQQHHVEYHRVSTNKVQLILI